MNHEPPSDRTQAAGLPPMINPGLSAGDPPAQHPNEKTNPISSRGHPNLAKRTQSPPPAAPQLCETNPIPVRPTANRQQPKAAFCETNPIYPHANPASHKKRETNPIYHPAAIWPPKSPRIIRKRTLKKVAGRRPATPICVNSYMGYSLNRVHG